MTATPQSVDVAKVREWLADGGEIAFVDVREEGQHGEGHPLLAVNLPYSRLEIDIGRSVPRLSCRIVLVDDGDGVSEKAARRLAGLGYSDIRVLAGGAAAWDAAGYRLFPSSNVPSKAFAEIIEHECATPAISAEELDRLRRSGQRVIVLDSRPLEEYARFHVPGAVPCPGAELVHRFADAVPSPDTLVVVSCAGRTRGIIGAQSLINAGVPNQVMSLAGGTQGWRLAGYELANGLGDGLRPVSAGAAAAARRREGSGKGPLWHSPYRSRDPFRMAGRGRPPHDPCSRRAHTRGIRRRPPARLGFGAGRPIGPGDRPMGRDSRRAPRPRR